MIQKRITWNKQLGKDATTGRSNVQEKQAVFKGMRPFGSVYYGVQWHYTPRNTHRILQQQ